MAIRTFAIVPALVSTLGVVTAVAPTASAQTYHRASAVFTSAAYLGEGFNASHWRDQQSR